MRQRIAHVAPAAHGTELRFADPARAAQAAVDQIVGLLRQGVIITFHIEFEVKAKAARVPVARAQQHPVAVHRHQLGVIERRRREMQLRAFAHQPAKRVQAGPLHQPQVVLLRHHDVHPHPFQQRQLQARQQGLVGHEIRRDDAHFVLGGADRRQQCQPAFVEIRVRAGIDAARQGVARFQGAQVVVIQGLAAGKGPVGDEAAQQMHHRGALHPGVQVLHVCRLAQVAGADVHTAGEADAAVHHHQFAVVAQVQVRHSPGGDGVQKALHAHAPAAQAQGDRRQRIERADAVHQHPHGHAARHRPLQGLRQRLAGGVVAEDIGGQQHTVTGLVHRLDHRRQGRPGLQQRDPVTAGKRQAGETPHQPRQHPQAVGLQRRALIPPGAQRGINGAAAGELAGAPLYAVHAQQQIQQGADQRHQPYQAGPGRGSTGIPFVLRHMQRHPDRRDHAGGGDDGGPEHL